MLSPSAWLLLDKIPHAAHCIIYCNSNIEPHLVITAVVVVVQLPDAVRVPSRRGGRGHGGRDGRGQRGQPRGGLPQTRAPKRPREVKVFTAYQIN